MPEQTKTNQILGDPRYVDHPDTLDHMRNLSKDQPDDIWYAYQNHDLGHPELGHLKFLVIGPTRTGKTPPQRLPDMPTAINWRYMLVGKVDLVTGKVVPC